MQQLLQPPGGAPQSHTIKGTLLKVSFEAVLSGRIDTSPDVDTQDLICLESILLDMHTDLQIKWPHVHIGDLALSRGLIWQFRVEQPLVALRLAVYIRAKLIILGTRRLGRRIHGPIAIGVGQVFDIPELKSMIGKGDAYQVSEAEMWEMRPGRSMLNCVGLGRAWNGPRPILSLIDTLSSHWTDKQATAVSLALLGYSQMDITQRWEVPVTRQVIQKHLRRAGWSAVDEALSWQENLADRLIREEIMRLLA